MGSVVDDHGYPLAVAHVISMQVDVDVFQLLPLESRGQETGEETNVKHRLGGKVVEYQLLKPLGVVTNGFDIGNQTGVSRILAVDTPCLSKGGLMSKSITILERASAEYEGGYLGSAGRRSKSQEGSSRQLRQKEIYEEKEEEYQFTAYTLSTL